MKEQVTELKPRPASGFERKYKKSFLYSGIGQIITRGLSIAVMIIVVRLLSREAYGVYTLLLSMASMIGVLTTWGWPSVFIRYIPQLKEEGNRALINSLVIKGILSRALVTSLGIVLLVVFFDEVGGFLNVAEYREYVLLFSFGILGYIMLGVLQQVLNAHLDHKYTYTATVSADVIKNLAFVGVLLLGFGLAGLILVESVVALGLSVILGWFVWHRVIDRAHLRALPSIPTRIKKYNAFSYLNDVGVFFLDISIDTLIIAKYMGLEYVALYTVGAAIPTRIKKLMPTSLLRNVLEPMTYSSYAKDGSDANLNRIFHYLVKLNYIILFPIFAGIVFFGKDLLHLLFGERYLETYPYLVGLSFFFFLQMFPIGYVTKAKEKMHIAALSKVFSLYNLILNIILVQRIGLIGIVLATGSAQFLRMLYVYWHTKRFVKISFPIVETLKLAVLSVGFVGLLKWLQAGIDFGWALLLVVALFGLIPFVMSLFKLNYFTEWETRSLEVVLGSLTGKKKTVAYFFSFVR